MQSVCSLHRFQHTVNIATALHACPTSSTTGRAASVVAAAVPRRLAAGSKAASAFAEPRVAPFRQPRQPEVQRPRNLQQSYQHSQPNPAAPPAGNSAPASTQQVNTADEPASPQHEATTAQHLHSAINKMYRKRLREVKALLQPGVLQQQLTPDELASLQLVLQDVRDLQSSWEEEDEQLTPAEKQVVQQLQHSITPKDFNSYLLTFLPEGSGAAELQQLMQTLDPVLLQDIQSVYIAMKEFEQTEMELSQAQDVYVELSSRIAAVAARVQQTLDQQQQQLRRQQQQRQSQQRPSSPWQRLQPKTYSGFAFRSTSSSSSSTGSGNAVNVRGQSSSIGSSGNVPSPATSFPAASDMTSKQPGASAAGLIPINAAGSKGSDAAVGSMRSTGSSSRRSKSSKSWGSNWAKPRTAHMQQAVAQQHAGSASIASASYEGQEVVQLGNQQQQQQQQQQQHQQTPADMRRSAQPLLQQQPEQDQQQHFQQIREQQQQAAGTLSPDSGARQRRRRTIIRPTGTSEQ